MVQKTKDYTIRIMNQRKKKKIYELFPTKLYILLEIAITLVIRAKTIIVTAMILSFVVDIPLTSLQQPNKRYAVQIILQNRHKLPTVRLWRLGFVIVSRTPLSLSSILTRIDVLVCY